MVISSGIISETYLTWMDNIICQSSSSSNNNSSSNGNGCIVLSLMLAGRSNLTCFLLPGISKK